MAKRTGARGSRRKHGPDDRPMEFEKGWHELEERHERLKADMASLAALLGSVSPKEF